MKQEKQDFFLFFYSIYIHIGTPTYYICNLVVYWLALSTHNEEVCGFNPQAGEDNVGRSPVMLQPLFTQQRIDRYVIFKLKSCYLTVGQEQMNKASGKRRKIFPNFFRYFIFLFYFHTLSLILFPLSNLPFPQVPVACLCFVP